MSQQATTNGRRIPLPLAFGGGRYGKILATTVLGIFVVLGLLKKFAGPGKTEIEALETFWWLVESHYAAIVGGTFTIMAVGFGIYFRRLCRLARKGDIPGVGQALINYVNHIARTWLLIAFLAGAAGVANWTLFEELGEYVRDWVALVTAGVSAIVFFVVLWLFKTSVEAEDGTAATTGQPGGKSG